MKRSSSVLEQALVQGDVLVEGRHQRLSVESDDGSHTPWGKPAMEVVKRWYTR